jgi:hypothetical protein
MIDAAIVSQAQWDIKQKLRKLEGFAGMNTSQLLEVPQKSLSIKIRRPNARLIER